MSWVGSPWVPFWVSVSLFGVLVLCPSLHRGREMGSRKSGVWGVLKKGATELFSVCFVL